MRHYFGVSSLDAPSGGLTQGSRTGVGLHDGDPGLETVISELGDSWSEFSAWMQASGAVNLLSRYPGMATADAGDRSVEEALIASGVPPSVARSLLEQQREDQDFNAVSHLQFSPGVTGIARIGTGATSNVYASQVHDVDAMKADLPDFLVKVAGIDRAQAGSIEREVAARIDLITSQTGLVVTKVLKSRALLPRTEREIRTVLRKGQQLPGVPAVVGGKSTPDSLLFHMEHVPGLDLQRLMNLWSTQATPMRFNEDVAALCARAIAMTARAGILHRDVKPANFRVANDGRMFMLDLGFAKNEGGESQQSIEDGTIGVGTPVFIAPEQARREPGVTSAADVFSLGVMLWRMYAGQFPHIAPNAAFTVIVSDRTHLYPGAKVPEFCASPEAMVGVDPKRAERFLRKLKPMLESMIDPDPDKRPAPEDVADFFRSYSSFGASSTEEFMQTETYHQYRLALDPPVSIPEGDVSVKHGYADDVTMLAAIIKGVEHRREQYDFLADPAFDVVDGDVPEMAVPTPSALKTLPYEARTALAEAIRNPKETHGLSKRVRIAIGGTVVVILASIVALIANKGGGENHVEAQPSGASSYGKKTDGSPAVQQSAQQHAEPSTVEVPQPPERAVELKIGSDGPEEFRLFRTDSINFGAKDLMALYAGNGKDHTVVGAGFVCTEEHIARILKLADVSQIPQTVRRNLENVLKQQGGIMGYALKLEDGTRCTWITSVGLFVENSGGEMVFFSNVQEFAKAREAEFTRHGELQDMTTDPVSIHFLRNAKDVTDTGVIPAHWSGELTNPDVWKRAINQLLSFRNKIKPDTVGQR